METYNGHVRTPHDAIILFEACRIGLLPRVQRRLSEKERQQIKSGSVFVWDEREAGMRRWTDGKSWSASRVSGSFLTYREMEGKRGGSTMPQPQPQAKRPSGKTPDGSATGDSGDEGPDGYRYKADGLLKQSFSITTSTGQHLHLISYFSRSNPSNLMQPSTDPSLRHIRPPKNMYPESTVSETQSTPPMTRGPMPGSPYASAPHQIPSPSPYHRPSPGQPIVVGMPYSHPPPNGAAQYPAAVYYQMPPNMYPAQYFYAAAPPYGHPHPQTPHIFDRPPPPPGATMMGSHPGYAAPQYVGNTQARPMQASEHPQHQAPHQAPQHQAPQHQVPQHQALSHQAPQHQAHATNGHHHAPIVSASLPEQGPQLPAINAIHPSAATKPPSPPPSEPKSQESLAVPESNGAVANNAPSPARTIPALGSILNHDSSTDKSNHANSRSGSRSPNSAQRLARELPADKLASNSMAADTRALDKLNRNMFGRV